MGIVFATALVILLASAATAFVSPFVIVPAGLIGGFWSGEKGLMVAIVVVCLINAIIAFYSVVNELAGGFQWKSLKDYMVWVSAVAVASGTVPAALLYWFLGRKLRDALATG